MRCGDQSNHWWNTIVSICVKELDGSAQVKAMGSIIECIQSGKAGFLKDWRATYPDISKWKGCPVWYFPHQEKKTISLGFIRALSWVDSWRFFNLSWRIRVKLVLVLVVVLQENKRNVTKIVALKRSRWKSQTGGIWLKENEGYTRKRNAEWHSICFRSLGSLSRIHCSAVHLMV